VKTLLSAALLAGACQACFAAEFAARPETGKVAAISSFEVERLPFGSGTPADGAAAGTEAAQMVIDGLYHVPNYMPGFPTAATVWPRELPVECESEPEDGASRCTGYRVTPEVGRGEYIFVRPYARPAPKIVQAPPPPPPQPDPKPAPVVTHKKPLE
jgi:hypothetical protein